MKKFKIYGSQSKEVSQRELEHKILARRAAGEGMVLLKNDGVLPIKPQKIALFGSGSRKTVKGGSGSGDVHERHSVTIEEGLLNAGFTFNTAWMDRFEKKFADDLKAWEDEVNAAIKKYNHLFTTMKMFIEIGKHPQPNPVNIMIENTDLDDAEIAFYVISRQAGEGKDRKVEKGDYLLSDIETQSIKLLSKHYKKLVLVINCGGPIDLSILDDTKIDGVLLFSQGGTEGGNAFVDIITGKVTPSGRLTDTWAKNYSDIPFAMEYSHLNGKTDYEEYKEGIFVGYRYFETFSIKPRYPFGYGLSYTEFSSKITNTKIDGRKIQVNAEVFNTGKYNGKEVLFLFVNKPQGKLLKEKYSLVDFAKTPLIDCNKSAKLSFNFDILDLASFDEDSSSFIVEKGDYVLFVGKNVEELTPFTVIQIDNTITLESVNKLNIKHTFKDLVPPKTQEIYENLPRLKFDTTEIESLPTTKTEEFSQKVESLIKSLTPKQKIQLVVGGGYKMNGYISVMGGAGRTNTNMLKLGIPNIMMSDGPAGVNVMPENAFTKGGSPRYPDGLPKDWKWGWLKHVDWLIKGNKNKLIYAYRYATAFPSETTLAQSFNQNLLYEVGKAVGKEMKEFGISVWLAPALNIHRNPLCGRNFEYYSEDPIVSGKMAAAITSGVQSNGGVGVSIKHYCCNNQEENRMGVDEQVSERTLREIYLKGFKIAVQNSNPWTVMSSYNRVNGEFVCNSQMLLTKVLRQEWGFTGLVMSDWDATEKAEYVKAINSGNDMIMPGRSDIVKNLLADYNSGKLSKSALDLSAKRVLKMIFNSHTSKDFI